MVGFADFVTPINMRLCDTDNDVLSPLLPLTHSLTHSLTCTLAQQLIQFVLFEKL